MSSMDSADLGHDSSTECGGNIEVLSNCSIDSKTTKLCDKPEDQQKGMRGQKRRMSGLDEEESTLFDTPTTTTLPLRDTIRWPRSPEQKAISRMAEDVPNVWVPLEPHYAHRPITSGSKNIVLDVSNSHKEDHGVFATADIAAGTRIISEPPLIKLPSPGDQLEGLMQAYHELPEHEQNRIWALKPSPISSSPLLEALAEIIDPVLLRTREIVCKDMSQRSDEEIKELGETGPQLEHALVTLRLAARWHRAHYALIELPEDERNGLSSEGTPITGLFVETAGLRHSCVPNCYAHYNNTTDRMTVHTTKSIDAGEELTLSSISRIYYLDAASRAVELKGKFDLTCGCEACDASHANFPTHEQARIRAYARAIQLEHFLTLVDVDRSEAVMKELLLTDDTGSEDPYTKEDFEYYEKLTLELIKDLHITGASDVELIRWYNVLLDRIQSRLVAFPGADERLLWGIMLAHATKCENLGRRSLGGDDCQFVELQRRKKKIEVVIRDLEEKMKRVGEFRKRVA